MPKSANDSIETLWARLQKQVSAPLRFHTSEEWGSASLDYRKSLRADIFASLGQEIIDEAKCTDLSTPPIAHVGSISISHTKEIGIWCWSPTKFIGIDIENLARIKPENLRRIATPQELEACPMPELLWSAKEASFKALATARDWQTMTQPETINWSQIETDLFAFEVRSNAREPNGRGLVTRSASHSLALLL